MSAAMVIDYCVPGNAAGLETPGSRSTLGVAVRIEEEAFGSANDSCLVLADAITGVNRGARVAFWDVPKTKTCRSSDILHVADLILGVKPAGPVRYTSL